MSSSGSTSLYAGALLRSPKARRGPRPRMHDLPRRQEQDCPLRTRAVALPEHPHTATLHEPGLIRIPGPGFLHAQPCDQFGAPAASPADRARAGLSPGAVEIAVTGHPPILAVRQPGWPAAPSGRVSCVRRPRGTGGPRYCSVQHEVRHLHGRRGGWSLVDVDGERSRGGDRVLHVEPPLCCTVAGSPGSLSIQPYPRSALCELPDLRGLSEGMANRCITHGRAA